MCACARFSLNRKKRLTTSLHNVTFVISSRTSRPVRTISGFLPPNGMNTFVDSIATVGVISNCSHFNQESAQAPLLTGGRLRWRGSSFTGLIGLRAVHQASLVPLCIMRCVKEHHDGNESRRV
jgi:hypothetical protein